MQEYLNCKCISPLALNTSAPPTQDPDTNISEVCLQNITTRELQCNNKVIIILELLGIIVEFTI